MHLTGTFSLDYRARCSRPRLGVRRGPPCTSGCHRQGVDQDVAVSLREKMSSFIAVAIAIASFRPRIREALLVQLLDRRMEDRNRDNEVAVVRLEFNHGTPNLVVVTSRQCQGPTAKHLRHCECLTHCRTGVVLCFPCINDRAPVDREDGEPVSELDARNAADPDRVVHPIAHGCGARDWLAIQVLAKQEQAV